MNVSKKLCITPTEYEEMLNPKKKIKIIVNKGTSPKFYGKYLKKKR